MVSALMDIADSVDGFNMVDDFNTVKRRRGLGSHHLISLFGGAGKEKGKGEDERTRGREDEERWRYPAEWSG